MPRLSNQRADWLAEQVLPLEPGLRRWLKSRRFRGVDIDDVVQETYAVMAALESIDAIRNVQSYVFSVAYSIIKRQLRRSQIVQITSWADMDSLGQVDEQPSQEVQVQDREALQQLAETIATLPDRTRAVFIMRKVEGIPQRQVAERLGMSEGAVEKRLARSLIFLMHMLGRGGDQGSGASTGERDGKVERQGHEATGDRRRNR